MVVGGDGYNHCHLDFYKQNAIIAPTPDWLDCLFVKPTLGSGGEVIWDQIGSRGLDTQPNQKILPLLQQL